MLLAYHTGNSVAIRIDLTPDCESATNGNLHRSASGYGTNAGPELITELEHLTGGHDRALGPR